LIVSLSLLAMASESMRYSYFLLESVWEVYPGLCSGPSTQEVMARVPLLNV
jgi:hypothetical protein